MKWLLLLCFFILISTISFSQSFSAKKIASVPSRLKYRGKLVEAWQWKDALGENILLLTLSTPVKSKPGQYDEVTATQELFAYNFIKNDTGYRTLWRINDLVKDCEFDLSCGFLKGSTSITDLDKNGIAETAVQYKLACRSDVSPAAMKLIMHQDSVKYALRGSMWVQLSDTDKFTLTESDANLEKIVPAKDDFERDLQTFGRYQSEKDFVNAPAPFIVFARKQWIRFAKESFE